MSGESIQVRDFKNLIETTVSEFVKLSQEHGEPLYSIACMVKKAFEAEENFIRFGVVQSKPDDTLVKTNIQPILDAINEIQDFRGKNRHVKEFNHLSTISESIAALTWINIKPAPAQYIKDNREAGEYYGNRVLTAHKGEAKHADWLRKYYEILKQLEQYVRDHHLTGFTWHVSPGMLPGRPGPPPPPPPPAFQNPVPDAVGDAARSALLNDINQGEGITRGLRHVKPKDKNAAPVSTESVAKSKAFGATQNAATAAEPKFFLDGRKWRVEHQVENYGLQVKPQENYETLAIFKCLNSGVEVLSKINGVSVDNCKRTTLVLGDVISSVEAVRCGNLKIVCQGHVPLVSIDNCDSVQVFLSESSRDAEIISSKSTSCNVCLLRADGDYFEMPIPEQIKTVVVKDKLRSSIIEHM